MTERVTHRCLEGAEVAVAHHDAFAVADMALLTREVEAARVVLQAQGYRLREVAGRVHPPQQDLRDRDASALTEQEPFEDRVDVVMPGLERDDTAIGEDDDRALGDGGDLGDQPHLLRG